MLLRPRHGEGPGGFRGGVQPFGMVDQAPQGLLQGGGISPPAPHLADVLQAQGHHEGAPVVAHHLGVQVALVGFQGLGKEAAAVEGMLPQHAVAPGVDGGNRRLVHPLRGQLQPVGAAGPLRWRVDLAQIMEQVLASGPGADAGRISAEIGRRLVQAGTNAVTQFLGGRLGEGDDQDLRRSVGAQGGRGRDLVSARGILLIIPLGVARRLLLERPVGIA